MSTDRMTVRTVVFTLAAVVLGGVAAMVFLTATGRLIPDQLDRVVSVSLGAIGGILAKTSSSGDDEPQQVEVVNEPTNAVPVDTAGPPPPPLRLPGTPGV